MATGPDRAAAIPELFEVAKAFYDGEMYRKARAKRIGTTEFFNMILVEGVCAPV